jgi:hypothetical protein
MAGRVLAAWMREEERSGRGCVGGAPQVLWARNALRSVLVLVCACVGVDLSSGCGCERFGLCAPGAWV